MGFERMRLEATHVKKETGRNKLKEQDVKCSLLGNSMMFHMCDSDWCVKTSWCVKLGQDLLRVVWNSRRSETDVK